MARLGGDEFVVMAGRLQSLQQGTGAGAQAAGRVPFAVFAEQRAGGIGLTIGYAIAPHDSTDAIGLLKLADAAMPSGKQGGKVLPAAQHGRPRTVLRHDSPAPAGTDAGRQHAPAISPLVKTIRLRYTGASAS